MACRNLEKAESAMCDIQQQTASLKSVGVIFIKKLDLASFTSIRECAADIIGSEEHIHLLVNNAGKISDFFMIFFFFQITQSSMEFIRISYRSVNWCFIMLTCFTKQLTHSK